MPLNSYPLRQSSNLDITALSRLFKSTSTSYKFIFFQAILNKLQSQSWKTDETVKLPLEDLAVEMALLSWYPIKFYKLSFGWQDQVSNIIDKLHFDPSFKAITSSQGQSQLRAAIKAQAKDIGLYSLLTFVPYRLLSPFFSSGLKDIPEKRKNNRIEKLATEYNSQTIPLYRFVDNGKHGAIELRHEWLGYLLQDGNINLVKNWALWEWVNYLQKRNPNTPAIIHKVIPPVKRSSLNTQTNFWKEVITADQGLRCIYSGEPLANQSFSLDHFLPWTFVCHDQIWNLCPVTISSNSSKGNKLPADEYIDQFIQQQIHALKVSADIMSAKCWNKITESYSIDLHINPEKLQDEDALRKAYIGHLKPMITLAEQNGFESGWSFNNVIN